ncbi:MAG TPA: DUF3343 domain-containing protein [Candidatus Cloacimonadota bacterium]|nr:DUF3343 domain-containing protein [Candidatus Cloacimonadota bacterium]HOQ79536.1 DUF3343 domain-containing protein [Candidatus Cloacimonadota bacterium]HPK40988.1 DUF3343 domain-containing protein [Candidatus Cloacimonadota bacterium]
MKKIINFDSVHFTIKADSLFGKQNLDYIVITTPSYISTDCGMSIEINEEQAEAFCTILQQNNIKYKLFDKN